MTKALFSKEHRRGWPKIRDRAEYVKDAAFFLRIESETDIKVGSLVLLKLASLLPVLLPSCATLQLVNIIHIATAIACSIQSRYYGETCCRAYYLPTFY